MIRIYHKLLVPLIVFNTNQHLWHIIVNIDKHNLLFISILDILLYYIFCLMVLFLVSDYFSFYNIFSG